MILNSFNFNTTPGLRFGSGQAKDSCKEISKKLGSRILFITDKCNQNYCFFCKFKSYVFSIHSYLFKQVKDNFWSILIICYLLA